eukprot:2955131-Rhodomonas_salina.1
MAEGAVRGAGGGVDQRGPVGALHKAEPPAVIRSPVTESGRVGAREARAVEGTPAIRTLRACGARCAQQ